ncbi:unnamed protein product [Lymnaea stagnalis]|uniref:Flagellar FliJ protein n=1 Tax=Lymnaea stagnalis TaxID=6523 RepID=A0AAV2HBI0_LYMST
MSRETNLRYEQPHKPSKLYLEYMKNIKELEYLDSHNNTQKQTDQKQVFEQWLEESNKKQKAKQLATDKRNVLAELKLVAKANLLVRKRALALRIESDQKQFEAELAQMGKAFHKQRL